MADDQTQTVDPNDQQQALIQQMLRQTLSPQSYQPPEPPHSGDNRTWGSLLGQALVGGAGPGSTDAANEQAGLRALQQVGLGMMSGSDYSQQRHSLGSIIANSIEGAQQSNYAQNAAQLEYQNKQQEMQLARIKEAVPLLTLMQTQQQLANARNIALGNKPTGANVNIGAVGAPPIIPRDPNAGTAGQQANNSGNLMVPPGGALPAGAIGVVPVAGGRQVAAFPDAATGIAAQSDNLAAYQTTHGINTIRGAVTRWVGDPKADLGSYVADIAKAAGVDPDAPVDLTDPKIQRAFFMAQQPHESGKPWLNAADVDKGIALAQARRQGAKPPGAPAVAGAPQTPPAGPPAAPGVAQGDVAHPELAPGPPGSTGGAPTSLGAAVGAIDAGKPQYTVTPPPQIRAQPIPAGRTAGLVPSDVAAMQRGIQLAQETPAPSGVLAAGPGAGPSLPPSPVVAAPPATPQPGWGAGAATGYNVGATGAVPPLPPPAVPPVVTQPPPAAETTPPPGPPRVPDVPPPYVRGALPPEIQAQIDNPPIDPHLITALNTARAGTDIKAMQEANAAIATAQDKARAEAVTRAEAYHTAQQNIVMEAWKVRRAEQAANDTALQKQAFDERQATIGSANTRLNAEAADQGKRNGEITTAFGNNADAATRVRGSLAQARSVLTGLPGNPSSLLSNETTRPIIAGVFGGILPTLDSKATNADLFVSAINRAATEMSPKTLVGGERSSNINQYRAMLPGLASSPEGRELALNFADDMAENQQRTADWLTMHKEDPAFMNKRLGVPDLDKALVATRAEPSLRMPSLPPMPPSFDAKAAAQSKDFQTATEKYTRSIAPGQPFYQWQPGADGRLHAVKNTWERGNDGKWSPVPGSAP